MTNETSILRERARGLGFALCGVTSAQPLEGYGRFANWLAAGLHGGMSYLAADRGRTARSDPHRLVPRAQAVVVAAAMYPAPTVIPAAVRAGGVAAYALGDDYHDVLSEKLWRLCRVIDELAGRPMHHRVYTDSGPLLERELARRAGLGWIGKNDMLIHPQLGSHFFLGEIITEYPFSPDAPLAQDGCGTCDRCLRACPTGCILPNRTLDAARCISYLTIEHRGVIPLEIRQRMDRWIFGCDICQSVCPWNHVRDSEVEACFCSRPHFPVVDLEAEIALDEKNCALRFRRSPLRRTRREGYRRNVIIAIGNSHALEAELTLARILDDPDPVLRGHAAWALGELNTKKAQVALRAALQQEKDMIVQTEIQSALTRL